MSKYIVFIMLLSTAISGHSQEHSEVVKKELSFENKSSANVFLLANINGEVEAEAYNGDKVLLEAEIFIRAKTPKRLEQAKKMVSVGVLDRYDSIIVYINGPCSQNGGLKPYNGKRRQWTYQWNNCEYNFDFKVDFKLKLPQELNTYLSTINDGNIYVDGMDGTLDLNNINGSISAKGVKSYVSAHSINGDITLEYDATPKASSSYYSLNGDIRAYFPPSLKADVTFKSFNGDIYTDYEDIENKPVMVSRKDDKRAHGTSFKLESRSVISFGGGGGRLDFETFNGDVFIRKNK